LVASADISMLVDYWDRVRSVLLVSKL